MNYAPNNGCDECAVNSEMVEEAAYCAECSAEIAEMKEAVAFFFFEASSPKNSAEKRAFWSERYISWCAELKKLEG